MDSFATAQYRGGVMSEYRVVKDKEFSHFWYVQIRRWWLPVWLNYSWWGRYFHSKQEAIRFAERHASGVQEGDVEYLGRFVKHESPRP